MSEIEKSYSPGLAKDIQKPIKDPGIEPHRVRMTNKSEKHAKTAEKQIAAMFGVSVIGAIIAVWGFFAFDIQSFSHGPQDLRNEMGDRAAHERECLRREVNKALPPQDRHLAVLLAPQRTPLPITDRSAACPDCRQAQCGAAAAARGECVLAACGWRRRVLRPAQATRGDLPHAAAGDCREKWRRRRSRRGR